MNSILGIILILLLVGGARSLPRLLTATTELRMGRRFRTTCLLGAIVLFLLVAISTLLDMRVTPLSPPTTSGAGALHLPTRSVASDPAAPNRRILLHFLAVDRLVGLECDVRNIHELDVRWSAGTRRWQWEVDKPSAKDELLLEIRSLILPTTTALPGPEAHVNLSFLAEKGGDLYRSSHQERRIAFAQLATGTPFIEKVSAASTRAKLVGLPFSLLPRRLDGELSYFVVAHWVQEGDPLVEVSTSELLERTGFFRHLSKATIQPRKYPYLQVPAGGPRWLVHAGLGGVALLGAALLLALRIPHSLLAFCPLVLAAVLFAVGTERYRVGICRNILQSPNAAIEEKAAALETLDTFFFYGKTAEDLARTIARAPSEPEGLRWLAGNVRPGNMTSR